VIPIAPLRLLVLILKERLYNGTTRKKEYHMKKEERPLIRLTTSQLDFAVCAQMMSATDPWITLDMNYEQCFKAFDGECKEIYIIEKRMLLPVL